jgi:hypothetical protein
MADDGWAATATVEDWWREAALRFGKGVFWATIHGNRDMGYQPPILTFWPFNLQDMAASARLDRLWSNRSGIRNRRHPIRSREAEHVRVVKMTANKSLERTREG